MRSSNFMRGLVVAGAMLAPLSVAQAGIVTYDFTGTCTDCTGTVSAELTLSNYTAGAALATSNFVSFHYDGSNLFNPQSFTSSALVDFSGLIPSGLPAGADVKIDTSSLFFDSSASDGSWSIGVIEPPPPGDGGGGGGGGCRRCGADAGTGGAWSLAASTPPTDPTGVPEPGTLALLGAGLAAFGMLRRSRKA